MNKGKRHEKELRQNTSIYNCKTCRSWLSIDFKNRKNIYLYFKYFLQSNCFYSFSQIMYFFCSKCENDCPQEVACPPAAGGLLNSDLRNGLQLFLMHPWQIMPKFWNSPVLMGMSNSTYVVFFRTSSPFISKSDSHCGAADLFLLLAAQIHHYEDRHFHRSHLCRNYSLFFYKLEVLIFWDRKPLFSKFIFFLKCKKKRQLRLYNV